jgi:AcrR family transcriptional regulator
MPLGSHAQRSTAQTKAVGDGRARPGRRSEILEVFTDKVARQGYDTTSFGELADELEMSKGTIVHHFGSKDRMFEEMVLMYMNRRLADLEVIRRESENPAIQLRLLILCTLQAQRDDRAATIAVSREFLRFVHEPLMTEVLALRAKYARTVSAIIEDGLKQGLFRPTEPMIAALQIIGMCNWAWTWLRPDGRLTIEQVGNTFIRTVMNGVLLQADEGAMEIPAIPKQIVEMRQKRERELTALLGPRPPIQPSAIKRG